MEQFLKEAKEATKIISTLSGDVKNQILNYLIYHFLYLFDFLE